MPEVLEAGLIEFERSIGVSRLLRFVFEIDTCRSCVRAVAAVLLISVRSAAPLRPSVWAGVGWLTPSLLGDMCLEPVIGYVDLFELLLGGITVGPVAVDAIGVPLTDKCIVGALDLVYRSARPYAEEHITFMYLIHAKTLLA
jgi:hypothetical protein